MRALLTDTPVGRTFELFAEPGPAPTDEPAPVAADIERLADR